MMQAALLLVDLQNDFLDRPGLIPARDMVVAAATTLLQHCRDLNITILHAQTKVRADGTDRMPHWIENGIQACVAGTPGIKPPSSLQPLPQERRFSKSYYSAFENSEIEQTLHTLGIDTLIVAGIYLHGCIRATVLDAYTKGFKVWIAQEAVASTEPMHAEITRDYLHDRAATFLGTDEILSRLGKSPQTDNSGKDMMPVACIANAWQNSVGACHYLHRNPNLLSEVIAMTPYATKFEVRQAGIAAREALSDWQCTDLDTRVKLLEKWQQILQQLVGKLADSMAREIGKPTVDAKEEIQQALQHIWTTLKLAETETVIDKATMARYQPVGCIGIITPWNNPLAIPVAKITAALVFGNSVVWKPACQAAQLSKRLMESLIESGLPPGVVNLVFGDADTTRHMIRDDNIHAITLTGSIATGHTASALCNMYGKPLQAELGGNNAVIVLADADLDREIDNLSLSAFSFAGQRCTAVRRFVVEHTIADDFEYRLTKATTALQLPPLISEQQLQRVDNAVNYAVEHDGARLLCGGKRTAGGNKDCRYEATLITAVAADSNIVQEETFGPVAVIQRAQDMEEAIALVNQVPQGLVAGLLTQDPGASMRFCRKIEAGILKLGAGSLTIHPEAPFGGWKASQAGPPEHGLWDRTFYTRPQAVYRETEGP